MNILLTGVRLTKRGFMTILILHFTFFTWYFVFPYSVLQHFLGSSTWVFFMAYATFNFIIAITLVSTSFYIHKFNKVNIIYLCSLVMSLLVVLLLFVSDIIISLIIIFVEGIFFGIGHLAFFTYFWSLTASEERGRTAGLAGFLFLPFFHLISLSAQTLDFFGVIILSLALSFGSLSIKLLRPKEKSLLTAKKSEKEYNPEKRNILFFSLPLIIYSLVNVTFARDISINILQYHPAYIYMLLMILQVIATDFGALGGGIIADLFGRRLALVLSLTLYGISSALAGFVQHQGGLLCFVYVANGVNWGILWILYGFVVWGDLANKESCAKRYAIGLTVFYATAGLGFLLTPQISQIPLAVSSLASCLLIFLSNLPLILAPELLSSDFREKIKFKLYKGALKKITRKLSQNQG